METNVKGGDTGEVLHHAPGIATLMNDNTMAENRR